MKRFLKSAATVLALSLSTAVVFGDASPGNIVAYNGTGNQHNTPVYAVDYSGTQQQAGDLSLGMKGTAANTLSTQADSTIQVPIYLSTNSVSAAVQGSVIVAVTPINGQVTGIVAPTGASNLTTVLGIADAPAATGTVMQLDISGSSLILTTGTVAAGDLLTSTGGAVGYAATNNSASAGAVLGTAVGLGSSATPGLTEVILHH